MNGDRIETIVVTVVTGVGMWFFGRWLWRLSENMSMWEYAGVVALIVAACFVIGSWMDRKGWG